MRQKKSQKLTLKKETLRRLISAQLSLARGGTGESVDLVDCGGSFEGVSCMIIIESGKDDCFP